MDLKTLNTKSSLQKSEAMMTDVISAVLSKYKRAAERKNLLEGIESIWDTSQHNCDEKDSLKKFCSLEVASKKIVSEESEKINLDVKTAFRRIPSTMRKKHSNETNSGVPNVPDSILKNDGNGDVLLSDSEESEELQSSLNLCYITSSFKKEAHLETSDSCGTHLNKKLSQSLKENTATNTSDKVKSLLLNKTQSAGQTVDKSRNIGTMSDKKSENWWSPSSTRNKASSPLKPISHKNSMEEWSRERFSTPRGLNNNPAVKAPSLKNDVPLSYPHLKPTKEKISDSKKGRETYHQKMQDYIYGVQTDDTDDEHMEGYDGTYMEECDEGNEKSIENLSLPQSVKTNKILYPVMEIVKKLEIEFEGTKMHSIFPDALNYVHDEKAYGIGKINPRTKLPHNSCAGFYSKNSANCHSSDRPRSKNVTLSSEAMLNLEVFNEDNKAVSELTVLNEEILEIKKQYSGIFAIFPDAGGRISIPYSASAISVILRCLFHSSFKLPSWEVALEVYSIAKKYNVSKLLDSCHFYFQNNIVPLDNVLKIAQIANYFEVQEALKNARTISDKLPLSDINAQHIFCHSTISCKIVDQLLEFHVPLLYSKEEKKLQDLKTFDCGNVLLIEVHSGFYDVTGFQVKLKMNTDSNKDLHIFCDISKNGANVLEFKDVEKLESVITVHFREKISLMPRDCTKISITIEDVTPRWCHYITRETFKAKTEYGKFYITYTSKQSLYFIEKIFFTAKAD